MSTVIAKNVQVGTSGTAAQNFTLYQPATPDGTVRLANGNSGTTTDLVTVNSSGNLGLGVTPSAWSSSYKAIQFGSSASLWGASNAGYLALNAYQDAGGTNRYLNSNFAVLYGSDGNGGFQWRTAPSGTAGNAISFNQAMTLDASGNLGIGTSSPAYRIDAYASSGSFMQLFQNDGTFNRRLLITATSTGANAGVTLNATSSVGSDNFIFQAASAERMRLDSNGNLLVGITSGGTWGGHYIRKSGSEGQQVLAVDNGSGGVYMFGVNGGTRNGNATGIGVDRNTSTNRSINAAGTINASGADYAEYMTKAGDFNVARGDVVGVDAEGKLTNVFANAISFCVKSTDPSYVGNDSWGANLKGDALEAARQKVDRIAFAGQVPVNVMGTTPGQYIVPVDDNGAIKGIAKNEADMTLADYMKAVGKVIAVQDDGRAFIIVKIA